MCVGTTKYKTDIYMECDRSVTTDDSKPHFQEVYTRYFNVCTFSLCLNNVYTHVVLYMLWVILHTYHIVTVYSWQILFSVYTYVVYRYVVSRSIHTVCTNIHVPYHITSRLALLASGSKPSTLKAATCSTENSTYHIILKLCICHRVCPEGVPKCSSGPVPMPATVRLSAALTPQAASSLTSLHCE